MTLRPTLWTLVIIFPWDNTKPCFSEKRGTLDAWLDNIWMYFTKNIQGKCQFIESLDININYKHNQLLKVNKNKKYLWSSSSATCVEKCCNVFWHQRLKWIKFQHKKQHMQLPKSSHFYCSCFLVAYLCEINH